MKARTPEASAQYLARALGISTRQARRYKADGTMPAVYAILWAVVTEGDLGAYDAAFAGWRVRAGQLLTPEGVAFRPGEIRSIPVRLQHIRQLERDAAEPRQLMLATC